MELGDRTGTVEARMWDQFDALAREVSRDDFIKVQGRVELYRNKPQLTLQQFRVAKPRRSTWATFCRARHTTWKNSTSRSWDSSKK